MNSSCSVRRTDSSLTKAKRPPKIGRLFFGPYGKGWFLHALAMRQEYDRYTPEDHGTWNILYDRQLEHLEGKAYSRYMQCVEELKPDLQNEEVADFRKVEPRLQGATGWSIEVVKGLIPVEDFFTLLAEQRFCSSTWLRKRSQLDYLEEPDMFHDTFGHLPLLLDETYASFMRDFGRLGARFVHDPSAMTALQRLYWFTIEFGLIQGPNLPEMYGAGVLSSFGEVDHVYSSEVEILDFDLDLVIRNHFVNSEIQMRYYMIDSLEQLYDSLGELEEQLQAGLDIEEDIVR